MDPFTFDSKQSFFSLVVPTDDTTKNTYLLDKLLQSGHNVLLMGETGVGKSAVTQAFLDRMANTDNFVSTTINYSAQTSPKNLREIFELSLDKKRKNLLGPPAGKKMLFFVDDINMPALEFYGAQVRGASRGPWSSAAIFAVASSRL